MAGLVLTTGPVKEPVTLAELKDHLRVDHADDDALLHALNNAARAHAEAATHRAFVNQTWDAKLDAFPDGGKPLVLPMAPLSSVTQIDYVDTAGSTQTWSNTEYTVYTYTERPGFVQPNFNKVYPTTRNVPDAVTVTFVAGYGTDPADVPETLRLLVKLLAAHWYDNREPVAAGVTMQRVPDTVERLIHANKVYAF